jgi:hypothetical protein
MRRAGFIVLVLLFCGVLAWACKGEPKDQVSSPSPNPVTKESIAQSQVGPSTATEKEKPDVSVKPKILFEQTEYDFGKVDQGEKIEHLFRFKNTGNASLVIHKVRSS